MNRRIKRAHVLIGAALLGVVVVPLTATGSVVGSGGPEATASGVNQQVKKLKKRVKKLEQQVDGLAKQQGPPGQDATKLFGYIADPGVGLPDTAAVLEYGSGVTAVSDAADSSGGYTVTFNRSMVNCVVQATPGFGDPRGSGDAADHSSPFIRVQAGGADQVLVTFITPNSTFADTSFLITAFC